MNSLLLRPPALKSEGPNSYRMRLADSNILPFDLVDHEDVYGAKDDVLANQLWQRWLHMQGDSAVWLHRRARWCPRCLGDYGFGRVGWELLFADACASCGSWLVDVCHQCSTPVSWSRPSMTRCRCNANLCDAPSSAAPQAVVRLSQSMEQLVLGLPETEMPELNRLSPQQCSRLVRLLGVYGSSQHARAPQKIATAEALDVSWTVSSVAAEMLDTWPAGLHHMLERQSKLVAGQASSGRLSGVFGGFYRALYGAFKDPEFDWVRVAFEDYIAAHWSGAMGRRNLRMPDSLWSRLNWVPLSAAASQTGLSKRRISDLIESNAIQAARRTTASGREFVMVRQKDIQTLVSVVTADICLAEASSVLGVKRQRLSRLLPLLCPDSRKSTLHGTPWLIPKDWVHKWTEMLESLTEHDKVPPWSVSLDQLLRYGPLDDHRICSLLRDVEARVFQPIGRYTESVGLAGLLFHCDQLLERYGGQTSTILSIPDVADRLGVKQEVAYALANLGLLEIELYTCGRRQARGVSATSLEKFLACFVFVSNVAKSLGRSPRAVITALTEDGVKPVAGPALRNCRQTVYFRKDLETIPWLASAPGWAGYLLPGQL